MVEFGVIGVAGFASVWMLAWGAAAAIPLVLHLLNRRRQQTVSWAAMRLLMQVIEKQSKRVRIEQLLLLLLRTMILLTLALALARPFFTPPVDAGTVAAARAPRLWILVLDNSYSMGVREETGTRFTEAQNRAIEILRTSVRGDAFSILTLSAPSEAVVFRATFDVDAAIAALQKLSLLDGGADLPSAIALVSDVVAEANRSADIPSDVHVVFLSDFGQDTWQDALATGRAQRSLKLLADEQTVSYESVATSSVANVALTAVTTASSRALKDRPLAVDVSVINFGSAALTQLPLQVNANGRSVESQFFDLPAGASRVIHLNVQPTVTGLMTITAILPDDRLPTDNQRTLVVDVREGFRVLCVENPYSDARILKMALQPPIASPGAIRVTSVSQLELNLTDLSEFDAVVLNDVTSLSGPELSRLTQFVSSGRSMLLLLGQNSDAVTWNELLDGSPEMFGFRLTEPSEFSDWRIDPMDYASPIVAPFASHPDAGLLTTPIFRFWKVQLNDESARRPKVELQLQDGLPLVLLKPLGKGRVATMLSAPQTGSQKLSSHQTSTNQAGGSPGSVLSGSEPWNAMAAWPSFLPLMQQLVHSTLADSTTSYNLSVGEPLGGSQRAAGDTSLVRVMRPDGIEAEVQASATDANGMRDWSYPATMRRGLYQVTTQGNPPRPFSVNIDPVQSDLRSVATNRLPKSTVKTPSQLTANLDASTIPNSNAMVRWLLGALAVMLITESWLAWQLGRRLA